MSQVQKHLDALIGAITFDIKDRVLKALGQTTDDAPALEYVAPTDDTVNCRSSMAPVKRASRKLQGKLDVQEVSAKFLMHVKKNPGLRAEQVMEAIGASKDSRRLMPKIREALGREVKTKGQRRGMTYYAKGA